MDTSGDRRLQAEAVVDIGIARMERHLQIGDSPEDLPKALEILQGVKTQYPEQTNAIARAALRLGRYYLYTEKNIAAGKQIFSDCMASYPTNTSTELRFQLAYCSLAEKAHADCVAKCQAMIADDDVDPGWKAWTSVFLGSCYLEMEDSDSAKIIFQQVIDTYPDSEFSKSTQRYLEIMSHKAAGEGK